MLRTYPRNSPEAIGRIFAMAMITDAKVDAREIRALDESDAWTTMGLDRQRFAVVARDYLRDLTESSSGDTIRLVDTARINAMLDEIDDRDARLRACAVMLEIFSADREAADVEWALLSHVMQRWGFTPESLRRDLAGLRRRQARVLSRH